VAAFNRRSRRARRGRSQGFDFAALVLVGVSLGASITRGACSGGGEPDRAGAADPSHPVVFGVVLALMLRRFSGFDLSTAIFAAAPGGMTNMVILAKDAGGDGFSVALLHLVRLPGIFIFVPVVAFFLGRAG
jgi:uncharacterized membrane protein AbrB (regulator of aidB expression)